MCMSKRRAKFTSLMSSHDQCHTQTHLLMTCKLHLFLSWKWYDDTRHISLSHVPYFSDVSKAVAGRPVTYAAVLQMKAGGSSSLLDSRRSRPRQDHSGGPETPGWPSFSNHHLSALGLLSSQEDYRSEGENNPRAAAKQSRRLCLAFSLQCRLLAWLDLVWKWISPIHHHCVSSGGNRVMPFVKLKWDHGNIQLSLDARQQRNYRYDGCLCHEWRI